VLSTIEARGSPEFGISKSDGMSSSKSMSLISPISPSPMPKTHSEKNLLSSMYVLEAPPRSLVFLLNVKTSQKF
jgi:hypothetical protein